MKHIITSILVLSILCQTSFAQSDIINSSKQQVLNAQSARISAMIDADIEKLEDLLAEDLTYAHTTGWTETKTGYLKTVESKRIDYVSFVPRDIGVRIYEDIAVLTGLVDVNLGRTDFTIRFLEVQRQVDGMWQLTAWQSVINKGE